MLPIADEISSNVFFVKITFYFLKFFGTATITYDTILENNANKKNQVFHRSKKGLFYNVLLICLTICSFYPSINLSLISDVIERNLTEKVIDTSQTLLCFFTAIFILVIFCTQQDKVITISNKLAVLGKLSRSFDKRSCTKREWKLLKEVKIILFANLLTTVACIVSIPIGFSDVTMYFGSVTLHSLIINAMLVQYTIILKVIRHMFETINISLLCTLEDTTDDYDITFIKNCAQRIKLKRVSQLRDFYISVGRISGDVSNFYSPLMLSCSMNIFSTLIIYLYYVIKQIWFQAQGLMVYISIHNTIYLVFVSLSSINLVKSATAAVIESKKTGEVINESIGRLHDNQLVNLLNQFSNLLLHKNVNFSVSNLFSLDESLIIQVSSSIVTYLIILIQFKESNI